MHAPAKWKVLTREEILEVVTDLRRRAKRSINSKMNLTIFRLSCCYGLRVSEIAQLQMQHIDFACRHILIPVEITKSKRGREVPMSWSTPGTNCLRMWKDIRLEQGAAATDPFICRLKDPVGTQLSRFIIGDRWRTAIRCLGPERVKRLSIHCGRHSFCTHALASGKGIDLVRDAAGHSSCGVTDVYLHGIDDDREVFPD